MLKENKKILTFLLIAFVCLLTFILLQKPSNTLFDIKKGVYGEGSVYLGDEEKASLEDALTEATTDEVVYVDGELALTSDVTVKSGVTLSIRGELTIPTEYTLSNEGIITVESMGTLNIEGTLDLKYVSSFEISGDVNVENGSTVKTSASLTQTDGTASIILNSTGSLQGDENAFEGYDKIIFTNLGGTLSGDIAELLEEQGKTYSIIDETTNTYYETFSEVPSGTTVKVISSMFISNDIIPTNVEVIVENGLLIKVTDLLTINGALRMNESELQANAIEGTGLLEVVPGSFNTGTSSYLIYTTIGTIQNTVTLNGKNGTAGLNDVYFKIDKSSYSDAKTVADAVKLGNNLKAFTSYVATKDCDDYATSCEYEYLFKLSHKDVPDGALYKQILKAYYVVTQEPGQPVSTDYTYLMNDTDFAAIETILIDTRSLYDEGNDNDPEPYLVRNFTGIGKLTGLKEIEITVDKDLVSSIDFTSNTNLENFTLSTSTNGKINSLDFNNLANLKEINASESGLSSVTLGNNSNLETIDLSSNDLTSLNLTGLIKLKTLNVSKNKIEALNTSSLKELETLNVSENKLTLLETSNSTKLKTVDASKNEILDVDFLLNENLEEVILNDNKLFTLSLGSHTALKNLYVQNNSLVILDLNGDTNLETLYTYGNNLSAVDFTGLSSLKTLLFGCADISGINLIFNELTSLETLIQMNENNTNTCVTLPDANLSANTSLKTFVVNSGVKIESITLPNSNSLETLSLPNVGLTSIDLSGVTNISTIDLSGNDLTTLDISNNTNLTSLDASNNKLTTFKSRETSSKISVDLSHNLLETLDIENTKFEKLDLSNNKLTSVELQNYTDLEELNLFENELEEVKIVGSTNLIKLNLGNNNLTKEKLNLTNLTSLEQLDLSNNAFIELDLSALTSLKVLNISDNDFGSTQNKKVGDTIDAETLTNPVKLPFSITLNNVDVSENLTKVGNTITITDGGIGTITLTYEYTDESSTKEFNVIYNVKAPKATSSKYTINEEEGYIYISSDKIEDVNTNIIVSGGVGSVNLETSNFEVRYLEDDVDPVLTYKIISFSLTDIEVVKNSIILTDGLTWKDIKDALVGTDLSIKLFKYEESETEPESVQPKEKEEGTTGNTNVERVEVTEETTVLEKGMEVDVFIGSDKVDMFRITDDFINVDGLTIDNNLNLIVGLSKGTTVDSVTSNISTSGTITWYDKDGILIDDTTDLIVKTGQTVKIELSSETIEYTISIKGDVNGDGGTSISDVMRLVSHILDGEEMTKDCYLQAADVNNDGNLSISDVMMLVDISLQ